MKKAIPLTPEQQMFAADHHELVFNFLRENGLPENDFYDIVIFGYLKAVARYFAERELRQYTFGTIAWKSMQGALANHRRTLERKQRIPENVCIHLSVLADAPELEQPDPFHERLMTQLEADLILHDLAKLVSQRQMDAVRMRSDGYGIRDIAHRQQTTTKEVNALLDEAHRILRELCYE